MTDRRGMLAKVHVAKKQLAMADDSYRAMVSRVTGRDSSKDCTDAQLERLLGEFTRLGFAAVAKPKSAKPWTRKIHAIWKELAPLLDEATGRSLDGFVSRQTGVAKAEWLDAKQATAVIQGLEGWLGRMKAERKAKS